MQSISDTQRSASERSMIDYQVTPKVIYGEGRITQDGKETTRDLWMDFYEPLGRSSQARPAVVLTFGGSFHRGGPRHTFLEEGVQDTSMGDYGRKLAARGYVCFAIDYRLAPQQPKPDRLEYTDDVIGSNSSLEPAMEQINKVRKIMDLEPLHEDNYGLLMDAILSAAEDLNKAINYIREAADRFHIDPGKIALGGFSAGGVTSLNAAYGMHAPVAAVFTLSGGMGGFNILKTLTESPDNPPLLMLQGQYDLDGVILLTPVLLKHCQKINLGHELVWVPGFGHFYPAGASTLAFDGSRTSVEERIVDFLGKVMPVSR